jgi:hypothetical protein
MGWVDLGRGSGVRELQGRSLWLNFTAHFVVLKHCFWSDMNTLRRRRQQQQQQQQQEEQQQQQQQQQEEEQLIVPIMD